MHSLQCSHSVGYLKFVTEKIMLWSYFTKLHVFSALLTKKMRNTHAAFDTRPITITTKDMHFPTWKSRTHKYKPSVFPQRVLGCFSLSLPFPLPVGSSKQLHSAHSDPTGYFSVVTIKHCKPIKDLHFTAHQTVFHVEQTENQLKSIRCW